jgi:uncharacterized damage-inducible protein DinB
MTYYGAKELAESFRTVRKNTLQIAQDIPEDKYSFQPTPETRSIEKMLTHIALGYRFQYQINAVDRLFKMDNNFDFTGLMQRVRAEEAIPRDKAAVIELLKSEGEIWAKFVEGVSEEFLSEILIFPEGAVPPSKSRLELITTVKEHEMHHRGQLMLVQRMLGIVPHLTRQMQERMALRQQASQR